MYRQIMGFNGPSPYSIIYWVKDGEYEKKTVCYSSEEEQDALNRFHTTGDFYNSFEKARVYDGNEVTEYGHLVRKGA